MPPRPASLPMRRLLPTPSVLFGLAALASSGAACAAPAAAPPLASAAAETVPPEVAAWPGGLLDAERIALLPPAPRQAWMAYVEASERLRRPDRAVLAAELAALGQPRWKPAREGPPLRLSAAMTPEWFRGEEARRIADNVLSFQTPAGGWSKRIDHRAEPRQPGESFSVFDGWSYVGTFDNDATTEHLRFLAHAYVARPEERYRQAVLRGLAYVRQAQFPNGCWPQVYPLQGSYHDAATYNDGAMVNVLRLLRDASRGADAFAWLPAEVRDAAAETERRGTACVLASQVVVAGQRTVWGAQHDPLTLRPVAARAYEPAALSGGESAEILEYLMEIEAPSPAVVEAVHAAAAWFRRTAIYGYEYTPEGLLVERPGAGPLWARFYEIGTDRPIFSNRDGVVLYDWNQLDEERRTGYAWFRRDAQSALRRYERWARLHPRPL